MSSRPSIRRRSSPSTSFLLAALRELHVDSSHTPAGDGSHEEMAITRLDPPGAHPGTRTKRATQHLSEQLTYTDDLTAPGKPDPDPDRAAARPAGTVPRLAATERTERRPVARISLGSRWARPEEGTVKG